MNPITSGPIFRWGRIPRVLALLALAISVFAANFVQISSNAGNISILDEWSYIDYINQAADGGIVAPGAQVRDDSLDYLACHKIYGIGFIGSGCGEVQDRADFPLQAKSPAEIHPPTYFVLTAQLAKVVDMLFPQFDLIDSARYVGSLWLLIGLGIWLFVFEALGIRLVTALSITALVAFSPLVLSVTNFITPDATFAISSGIVFFSVILWLRKPFSSWWLLLIGTIPVAFKVTHLLTAFAAAALLLAVGLQNSRLRWKQLSIATGCLLGGTAIGLVGWQLIRSVLRVAPSPSHDSEPVAVNLAKLVEELGFHFSALPQFPTSNFPISPLSPFIVTIFGWLLLAASMGGIFYLKKNTERRMVSIISTTTVFFGAAFLSVITLILAGGILAPEPRYGLPFLLLWTMPLALAIKGNLQRYAIGALAVMAWVAALL